MVTNCAICICILVQQIFTEQPLDNKSSFGCLKYDLKNKTPCSWEVSIHRTPMTRPSSEGTPLLQWYPKSDLGPQQFSCCETALKFRAGLWIQSFNAYYLSTKPNGQENDHKWITVSFAVITLNYQNMELSQKTSCFLPKLLCQRFTAFRGSMN